MHKLYNCHCSNPIENLLRYAAKSYDIQASSTLSCRPPMKNNSNTFEVADQRRYVKYTCTIVDVHRLNISLGCPACTSTSNTHFVSVYKLVWPVRFIPAFLFTMPRFAREGPVYMCLLTVKRDRLCSYYCRYTIYTRYGFKVS